LSAVGWRKQPGHRLVAFKDVRSLTGLDPEEVLLRRDTQQLVRVEKGGRRVQFIRIPLELLTAEREE
jgi:hypothetical protein